MLAGAQYVAKWVLGSGVTFLFLALVAPALICAPLWAVISRRIGKERAFTIASIIFALAALSLLGLIWAPGPWLYAPVAVAGAAYAGMQTLPMAMLPDVISHDARTHGDGRRRHVRRGVDRGGDRGHGARHHGADDRARDQRLRGVDRPAGGHPVAGGDRRHRDQLQRRAGRAHGAEPARARPVPAAQARHRAAILA